jgi:hypothetical protein
MPIIELSTVICAPRERVFDLARSIDAHQDSAGGTQERAVGGVTCGLIGMGDEVTWEARHFGVRQRLTARVTAFDRPKRLQDVMISGAFKPTGRRAISQWQSCGGWRNNQAAVESVSRCRCLADGPGRRASTIWLALSNSESLSDRGSPWRWAKHL